MFVVQPRDRWRAQPCPPAIMQTPQIRGSGMSGPAVLFTWTCNALTTGTTAASLAGGRRRWKRSGGIAAIPRRGARLGPGVFSASRRTGAQRMGPRSADRGQARPPLRLRGGTSRRHPAGVDRAHPRERMEEVLLGDGGRTNPAYTSGLARSLSATRFAPGGRRTGKSLAGGGLAGGGARTLSLLLGPPPPAPHQSPLPETEPLPLAHRTVLPALQR